MSKLWTPKTDVGRKVMRKISSGKAKLSRQGLGFGQKIKRKLRSRSMINKVFQRLTLFRVPPPNRR